MPPVHTEFTSDATKLLADYQKIIDAQSKQLAGQQQVADASKRSAQEHEHWAESQLGHLKGLVAGYLSVHGALELVTRALEHKYELERKSAEKQIEFANAQAGLIRNIVAFTPAEQQRYLSAVPRISSATGLPAPQVAQLLGAAAASGGNTLSINTGISAAELAARVAPDSPEEALQLTQGILAAARATGLEGEGDVRKNLGAILNIAGQSRGTSIGLVAENLIPAAGALRNFGDTFEQGAALASASTFPFEDAEGRRTRTATIAFGQDLQKFLPELGSTFERIQYLQQNAESREKFLDKATFETFAAEPFKQLLRDPSSNFAKSYLALATGGIPLASGSGPQVDKMLDLLNSQPVQQTARLKRTLGVGEEGLLTDATELAQSGAYRESLEKVMQASGAGWLQTKLSQASFAADVDVWGKDPQAVYRSYLGSRMRELRYETFIGDDPDAPQKARNIEELLERLARIAEEHKDLDASRKPAVITDPAER